MSQVKPPTAPSFNQQAFLTNFQGMDDLVLVTISSFLDTLPKLTTAIEIAIRSKNPADLEISAHTLKGALSNFHADPSVHLAWQLEQMGHGPVPERAEKIFEVLQWELTRLAEDLQKLAVNRKAA